MSSKLEKIVLGEMGLSAVPTAPDDKRKYENFFYFLVVQYKVALMFLRELLNQTFLRAIYHTSTRQAQLEYKEIQRTFVTKNALKTSPDVFTARNIIDHIEANCICDNTKTLIQIKNSISALLRYKGQDLVSWFQTFQPLVNRYISEGNWNRHYPQERRRIESFVERTL
jgi:hypothetical protein